MKWYNVVRWLVISSYAVCVSCSPDMGIVHLNKVPSFRNQSENGGRGKSDGMVANKLNSKDVFLSVKKKIQNVVKGLDHKPVYPLSSSLLLDYVFSGKRTDSRELKLGTVTSSRKDQLTTVFSPVETVFVTTTVTEMIPSSTSSTFNTFTKNTSGSSQESSAAFQEAASASQKPSSEISRIFTMSLTQTQTPSTTSSAIQADYLKMMTSYLLVLEHKVNSLYAKIEDLNENNQPITKELIKTETKYLKSLTVTPSPYLTSQTWSFTSTQAEPVKQSSAPPAKLEHQEHGQGAKDIMNMKPLPYKLSVKPQFRSHNTNSQRTGIYAKPKIVYNLGPEPPKHLQQKESSSPSPQETKWPFPQMQMNHIGEPYDESRLKDLMVKAKDENLVDYISRLVPELESLLDQQAASNKNELQNVDQLQKLGSDPKSISSKDAQGNKSTVDEKSVHSNSPFTTFKNKAEVDENYHRVRLNTTNIAFDGIVFPHPMEGLPHDSRRFKHQLRDRPKPHKRSRNHTGYNFNFFGLRSSGERLHVSWVLSAALALVL